LFLLLLLLGISDMTYGQKKAILFVCVENAGRSQMAEALFQKYAPKGYNAISAGTRPSPEVNPVVVQTMKEVGIDISEKKPKGHCSGHDKDCWQICKHGLRGQVRVPYAFCR
jgi:protein-tyrosine-phosphatase